MSNIINLTPHAITIKLATNLYHTIEPTGLARVESKQVPYGMFQIDHDGIDIGIVKTEFGEITGLPEPQPGVIFIVSMLVAQAAKRSDVISPDTFVNCERYPKDYTDEKLRGQINAVTQFQTF